MWLETLPQRAVWSARKHIEIYHIKPLSLIKARIIMHELLFKLLVKLNAGPALLSHRPLCEMLGPNLLLDLKLFPTRHISKAAISVSGAGDK